MTQQIGDEINELLQELVVKHGLQERQPGDVDAEMMAKATRLNRKYCSQILREKVLAKELVKIHVLGADGSPKTVYRKVK